MANHLTMADITRIQILAEAGWSLRKIARELGHDRAAVARYVRAAAEQARAPDEGEGSKPANPTTGISPGKRSFCDPHREVIEAMLEQGLSADRIWRDLREGQGFAHSYQSVKRYVRKLKTREPKRVWRMECEPGEEAQVDFGVIRTLRREDGKLGYANVLRVTLSFSRKGYTETLPFQSSECFIRGLENAFRSFGGVPATLRVDNLKAAVKQPDWYDPELSPKISAFAAHYGTVIIPTRPYSPEHKGKVESDIGYVKRSALKGKEFPSIQAQNEALRDWEAKVADRRSHGTTRKPVDAHFIDCEKAALRPLPPDLFPCYQEEVRVVHRDSYVEVKRAYYEVPSEHVGRRMWVRWDSTMVRILDENLQQVASHVRLQPGKFSRTLGARGQRKDCPRHSSLHWIGRAALFGPSAEQWAQAVARNRPEHCIRVLQGLLALHDPGKHLASDIDHACHVSLASGTLALREVRRVLALLEKPGGEPVPVQEQLSLSEEHPLIRSLKDYQAIVDPKAAEEESFSTNQNTFQP